jgi:hypothetical protein
LLAVAIAVFIKRKWWKRIDPCVCQTLKFEMNRVNGISEHGLNDVDL